jgi:transposase
MKHDRSLPPEHYVVNHKLTKEDIPLVRELLSHGLSIPVVAAKFEVSRSTIYRVKHRLTWQHIN